MASNDCTCKKCSGLPNKSCRLNGIGENCLGISIHVFVCKREEV